MLGLPKARSMNNLKAVKLSGWLNHTAPFKVAQI